MLNTVQKSYLQGSSRDRAQMSPGLDSMSGFLTPSSPYNAMEDRRNSIVSLSASDYSVATPTSERSPLSESSWTHVPYNVMSTQPMHGLAQPVPMGFPMKAAGTDQPFCEDWSMSDSNNAGHAIQFRIPEHGSTGASYLPPQMAAYTGFDGMSHSSGNSTWNPFPNANNSELEYMHDQAEDLVDPRVPMQTFWNAQMQSSASMGAPTIAPSDAMAGEEEYSSSPFMDTDVFDNAAMAMSPSPQGVFGKLDPTVRVKQELDSSEDEERPTRSIHVSPTGGKTVKKERRSLAKRKSLKSKSQLMIRRSLDGRIDVDGYEVDPKTGKRVPIDGSTVEWKYCDWEDCKSRFKRPEHLKRHQRIHLGLKEHVCRVPGCPKVFDRRDNYWQHGTTHIRVPGKKDGRNPRLPFTKMIKYADDSKHIEFLEKSYRKAVGDDYPLASEDEDVQPNMMAEEKGRRIRCRL
jgi:hypothetical protein